MCVQMNMYYDGFLFGGEFYPKPEMGVPALDLTRLSFLAFLEL